MSLFINLMPYAAVLTALIFPAMIAYMLWRALAAFERMSLAVEQIARNTRQ